MTRTILLALALAAQLGCTGNTNRKINEAWSAEAARQAMEEARKRDDAARRQAELQAESRARLAKVEQLEQMGADAEKAGRPREAFKQYLAALESLPEKAPADMELRVRKRVVDQARRLNPQPAIPAEAERQMVFGATALKSAKTAAEYSHAVAAFGKAARLAPWWAATYFNLGVVQDRAKNYEAAARSFQLYLLAAPDAPDAKDVRTKIYELEYKQQSAPAEKLTGYWVNRDDQSKRYRIEADGRSLRIYELEKGKEERVRFEGTLAGSAITGSYSFDLRKEVHPECGTTSGGVIITCSFRGDYQFSGEVAADSNALNARYDVPLVGFDSKVPLVGQPRLSFFEKSRAARSITLVRE